MFRHALTLQCVFPAGLSPGDERSRNLVTVTHDGMGRPLLRGTALAGALKRAYERCWGPDPQLFGTIARSSEEAGSGGTTSALRVCDTPLLMKAAPRLRSHNRIDRHTGTVADKAVFALESYPPGTRATLVLWLDDADGALAADAILSRLATLFARGLVVGGHAARGVGWLELSGEPLARTYDLDTAASYGAYLDAHRTWRESGTTPNGEVVGYHADEATLSVRFILTIPRGQDLLVADGRGVEYEAEPQCCTNADGDDCWILPGSTLRGLFRSWVTHLAAAEGVTVFDAAPRAGTGISNHLTGDTLGRAGADCADAVTCPIADLFGTLHAAGRIVIVDGVCRTHEAQVQTRVHVAVDRITGGAIEGALFDNQVLISPREHPVRFPIRMRVTAPKESEARWLASALRALDLGLLRAGSSKAAGRLCLADAPVATGPHAEFFNTLPAHREES
jgi:CRISPR/Cas system CSM-associated protein Csm3 (group 7 of RAMP superfamily)